MLSRLWRDAPDDLGVVSPWNPAIADRHAEATARLLLGDCGPAIVVGNRKDEQIVAKREQMAAEMRRRHLKVVGR